MQLTIKEVKIGKTGTSNKGIKWTQYQVIFEDGQKVSTFDHKIATMGGKTIEAELLQEGQFTNLGKWELVMDRPAGADPSPVEFKSGTHTPSTNSSIEAQVAVKEIGEALRVKLALPAGVEELYWAWIKHSLAGILPPATKPTPSAKAVASKTTKKVEPELDPNDIPF